MIDVTRTNGQTVGINSRRVLYVDYRLGASAKHGSRITMNNGAKIEVKDRPEDVIRRVSKDRKKG